MEKSVREALEKPFPRELHRTRRGSHGKELKYVEVARYVQRLNEATGGDWSFEVIENTVMESEVVVLGKLTVGSISKTAFGGSAITTARETGKPLSIGDDLKGAASDSLKKAASLLGIGLELYSDLDEEVGSVPDKKPEPGNVRPLRPPTIPPKETPKESTSRPTPASSTTSLTARQLSAIQKLGAELGMSAPETKTLVLKSMGVPLEKLSSREASEVISEFQARLTGRPGRSAARGAA